MNRRPVVTSLARCEFYALLVALAPRFWKD